MPRRTGTATRALLESISLPQHGGRYTVISHKFIIDTAIAELANAGLVVEQELYRCSIDGNIATGVYHIKHDQDQELGMVFTWANSYDKTMRFKCAVGAYVKCSGNLILKRDMGAWDRKHTGNADTEAHETIKFQISNAATSFARILQDKAKMKNITVDNQTKGSILGRLYFEKELLSSEQLNTIKTQFKTPKFDYNSEGDSLWTFYNHISYSLQRAHPKTWMDQQRLINWFLCDMFTLDAIQVEAGVAPVVEVVPVDMNVDELMSALGKVEIEEGASEVESKVESIDALPIEQEDNYLDDLEERTKKVMEPYHQVTLEEMIEDVEKEKTVIGDELIAPSNNYQDFDL